MKLAIVTAYPPSKINLSEYAYHLIKHLAQKEEIDELILLTDITEEPKDLSFSTAGCWVKVKQCWSYNDKRNLFTITKAINTTKPDAVLFNMQFMKFGDKNVAAVLGLLLPLVCKLKKIPNIVLLHNILEQEYFNNKVLANSRLLNKVSVLRNTVLTKMILQADKVVLTMQKNLEVYKSKYNADNLAFIPHGAYEIPEEPSYPKPEGPLKVTTFGKFGTYKKIETLVEAVEIIRERRSLDIEIVIAGTDDAEAIGYLDQMKKKYKDVKQIRFTGHVEEYEVPAIFKNSTAIIFPYITDKVCPRVLYRAAGYAKAIAMPKFKNLELLVNQEGYKGEFFAPANANSMADALEKILVNDSHREDMENTNYNAAKAYPMAKVAEMYLEGFKTLMYTNTFMEKTKKPTYTKTGKRIAVIGKNLTNI